MINKDKSPITFSAKTPDPVKEEAKPLLGITKEGGVGKYLGLPEHFGRRKKDLFTSIVDRIHQRALSCSTRHLSKAGKMTMIKSVLTAIPTYSMTCLQLPMSLFKRIQSVLTRFWWDGNDEKRKLCWVSWTNLTKSTADDGLGFKEIEAFDQAMLAKLAWRIITVPDCLLVRVLTGKYCHNIHFLEAPSPSACSHGWRGILRGHNLLKENLGKAIGNGLNTKIWHNSWISLSQNIKPFGPIREDALDLRVSDMLTIDL